MSGRTITRAACARRRPAGQQHDEVAKSGNRPRFKPADRCPQQPSRFAILLPLATIYLTLVISKANCDRAAPAAGALHKPAHHLLGQQHELQAAGHLRPPPPRARRAPDALKVAALATKLDHWLQCNRLASAGAAQTPAAGQPPAPGCHAHFDGHLCWPAARAGQTLRLACPQLNWLAPEEARDGQPQPAQPQLQSAKSVISAIQHQATGPNATRSVAGAPPARPIGRPWAPGQIADKTHEHAAGTQFAWRKCEPPDANTGPATPAGGAAKWQNESDYSRCRALGGQFDPTDEWVKLDDEADGQLFASLVQELDRIEANIDPYSDPDIQEQWSFCIGEIMRQQRRASDGRPDGGQQNATARQCPLIFDGWRCWPATRAGDTAYVSCPSNQPGFSAERTAHKICTLEGDWYRHPMTNRYWSNYTTCVDTVDLAFRTKILNLYVIGNLISLIALTASLIIFISFKSLNCTRVTIHKNLFLSFITNNLMWIIWYTYVVNDADLLQSNPIECQFWHILLHYFLVSNYFWMFCEGLYLHTLLVVAFVSEDKILKWFYLLGWLTPVPITVAYAYNRSYDEYYTNFCWMEESPHNIILMAPIGISLLLNLVFLINIVRVLVTKLRANNSPDTHQTMKAVRATLILIPLLGLHYMLTPFRPEAKSKWEVIYEIIAAVCTSFQGLCVAMLFCFCNGEVISVIKKKLKNTFRTREPLRSRGSASLGGGGPLNLGQHHNQGHNRRQLETSQTLRSVVSSSSNGDLAQTGRAGSMSSSAGAGQVATVSSNSRPNGIHSNNSSNTSSLLTTVTASPVSRQAQHQHHQQQVAHGTNSTTTSQSESPFFETALQGNAVVASISRSEEAAKLL